ncbi:hypothetical protein [Flammeovirga kamogawensis]|uniref:Tetratricopeptide repeat protein n=1 Tax=Flammeovirga kamogawensis TaxID=373891 RepID=A0ABX8GSY6_9BACT|nr:hypothetical protein [Flammeovirga kamogawensis]MBB6462717.1 TolB-like protein [Flammeovirga kamogawensis]QWG06050.1 hypothetical protein KM029_11825 [Flammeovirga kamogawensis]TRX67882.1 hypothetical protein EO216_06845 [Flammeovirga kamogawensis]
MIDTQLQEQLQKITLSDEFINKPKMRRLLEYIVTEYIEGRADQLKGYNIGIDVFEQGDSFDPDQNALVRINVGRLRRLLKLYYLEDGKNDPLKIDIPKGKYIPLVTPIENSIDENKNTSNTLKPTIQYTPVEEKACVTILPFKNLSSNKDLEYFCFGFSQDLSIQLSKYDDIKIIGSTLSFDNINYDNTFIEELKAQNIRFVIQGDMKIMGAQAKLSIHMTDLSDNSHTWGEHYKFNLQEDDLFDIQENITAQIATHVGSETGHINEKRYKELLVSKPTTYKEDQALLMWYFYLSRFTEDSHHQFLSTLKESLKEDPDSAILNALLGNLHGAVYINAMGTEHDKEECERLIEKAYTLNPKSQIVQVMIAYKTFIFDEKDRFFHIVNNSIKTAANTPLRLGIFANFLCLYGEWDKGIELLDRIYLNNIDFPVWLHGVKCLSHYRKLDYEKALVEANSYHVPLVIWGPLLRAACYAQLGRTEEAQKHLQELLKLRPDFVQNSNLLIRRFIKEESLAKHLVEGLEKAGFTIEV